MKKRVLFVDDDKNILDALRRMLHSKREEWEMSFVAGGAEGLALLEQTEYDLIVSDMRMPRMDGAQFLAEVAKRHPQTIRIILSGHADQEMAGRAAGVVHQYLSKPCSPEALKTALSRALALQELLSSETLKSLVARMQSIPSVPALYMEVVAELQRPDASIQKVADIIAKDIGMTAKILQLVNSAFFGMPRRITSTAQATSLLGLDTVRDLVLGIQVFSRFEFQPIAGFSLDSMWRHSMTIAAIAREIARAESKDRSFAEDCFVGGMLHDVGKLVIAAGIPKLYEEVLASAKTQNAPLWKVEQRMLGASHAQVGAYLLGLWGLPNTVVEAVGFHHNPTAVPGKGLFPLGAVHIADEVIAPLLDTSSSAVASAAPPPVNDPYIEAMGLTSRFPFWWEACQRMTSLGEAA